MNSFRTDSKGAFARGTGGTGVGIATRRTFGEPLLQEGSVYANANITTPAQISARALRCNAPNGSAKP
jgi:hypothetical protein